MVLQTCIITTSNRLSRKKIEMHFTTNLKGHLRYFILIFVEYWNLFLTLRHDKTNAILLCAYRDVSVFVTVWCAFSVVNIWCAFIITRTKRS